MAACLAACVRGVCPAQWSMIKRHSCGAKASRAEFFANRPKTARGAHKSNQNWRCRKSLRVNKSGACIGDAMGAAEKSERRIIKCLHPQRQPRNAGLVRHMRCRSADRICFQRYFSLRGELSVNMVQNIADQFSRHKRWRAAAKNTVSTGPCRRSPCAWVRFPLIGGQPIFLCRRVFMRRVTLKSQ